MRVLVLLGVLPRARPTPKDLWTNTLFADDRTKKRVDELPPVFVFALNSSAENAASVHKDTSPSIESTGVVRSRCSWTAVGALVADATAEQSAARSSAPPRARHRSVRGPLGQ